MNRNPPQPEPGDDAIEQLQVLLGPSRAGYRTLRYRGPKPHLGHRLAPFWRRRLWHPKPLAAGAALLVAVLVWDDLRQTTAPAGAGFSMPSRPFALPAAPNRARYTPQRLALPTAPEGSFALRFRLPRRPRPAEPQLPTADPA